MALHGLRLHHHGIRVDPADAGSTIAFYTDVLGLAADPSRRDVPGFPGAWLDCDNDAQVHLMGVVGTSRFARSPDEDPAVPHVAFSVPDIEEAVAELARAGTSFFTFGSGAGRQIFVRDPSGNMLELHQHGTCGCEHSTRRR